MKNAKGESNMRIAILTIDEIKALLAPIAEKYRVEAILLFGSYARGNANSQSDVDLVVFGGKSFHPTDIFAMGEEIRAVLHKQADVYEIREIEPGTPFYDTIFKEGVYVVQNMRIHNT